MAGAGVTVVVLTFNEERNLRACLESVVSWAAKVFVVDSGSTDATESIARDYGAQFVVHAFETHARQWAWALANLPIPTDWVLAIDADQSVTPELQESITQATRDASGNRAVGYFVNRRQIFRGRWIRHGGYYPKYLLKLFRRDMVDFDHGELVDHHFHIAGPCGRLKGDLIEDNRNEARIFDWTAKHNRYARLLAREEAQRLASSQSRGRLFGNSDERTAWLKARWARFPLYWRPFFYFMYRYVLRLGFLDGKEGFIFHFLQAYWYRLVIDINRDELRQEPAALAGRMTTGEPLETSQSVHMARSKSR